MERKRTFNNFVLIKLDPDNDKIKLTSGMEIYIDNTFDVEKNAVVTGEVAGLPSRLEYTGIANKGMPWLTDMELTYGDHIIMYYLSVVNALKPENRNLIIEGNDRYVAIKYQYLYAKYGQGFVIPLNGYCLVEPADDPYWTETKKRLNAVGLQAVKNEQKSKYNTVFGKIRYLGKPNREYVDEGATDEGCDVNIGDTVVMRRISDIPLCYDLHSKIDKGVKLWRVQRRNILAKI